MDSLYNSNGLIFWSEREMRTDFPIRAKFQAKNKVVEKDLLVLEVAIGLDCCVYNFNLKKE